MTKAWKDKIERNYKGMVVVVIDLKQVKKTISNKKGLEVINRIDEYVGLQLDLESYCPPPVKEPRIPMCPITRKSKKIECQYCGKEYSLHSIYGHEKYKCKLRPKE